MKDANNLLIELAKIGRSKQSKPLLSDVQPFKHFFDAGGNLLKDELDTFDGPWSRREILARYLFLNAVLDQGPDTEGVRSMLLGVVNELYKKEIRIFHKPLDFFKEIGVAIDNILISHGSVKKIRSKLWARENKTNPDKYNLFMDNSKQVLNYAIFRWGVPLSVPLLLEKDKSSIVEYLESWPSGEIMSQQIKDHERYGLGKAIGDKAAHLFAKWYIHSFDLAKNKRDSWGVLSFELPLDSNAGRVLFRTGWLLNFANLKDLIEWEVVQKNKGKGGVDYIRVTNLRGKKSVAAVKNKKFFNTYVTVRQSCLGSRGKPRTVEIQQIPNASLFKSGYGIGDLDDGLMYIGTNFCFNLEEPKCNICPMAKLCYGHVKDRKLIKNYRT